MRFPTAVVLALFASVAVAQELLTPERMWALKRVGELQLSPDGKQLLFSVRVADLAADKSTAQVFVLDLGKADAPRQLTDAGSNSNPMWLPGGNEIAYVSTRKDGPQIWVQPLSGGEARQVTEVATGVGNAQCSPDGKWFSFTTDVKLDADAHDLHPDLPKANARLYDDLMVRHWDSWVDGTYSHLFVVPAAGGDARDLCAGLRYDTPLKPFGGGEQIAWTPDSQALVYTMKRAADPEVSTDSSLWLVPVGGGDAKNLTPELPGYDQDPACSPDGRFIAFCSMARAGFEADRLRLMLHDRQTGKNRELLPDFDASASGLHWANDSKAITFSAEVLGSTQVFSASVDDGKVEQITRGRHAIEGVQGSGDALYALHTRMEWPAEIVRILPREQRITPVYDGNEAELGKLQLPTVQEEWFPATDGQKIHTWLVLPPGFDAAKKYPMLLFCQGGPQSMVGQAFSFRWNFHLMAAKGYVVAGVNRRGLPGFGQKWNDAISRDWGGQCMQDLLSVTDALQARPYIDKQRCGAVGASFGGYTVYWLMGHAGDRFACMIAHCGVFNLESMYLTTEELWFPNWDLGGPFWRSPEVKADYERFSPHRFVQNWKTPLFVIHGEKDFRVPYDQGLQAFQAAQLQGVPSRLLVFPDECHWVLKPQDGVLWQREFFGWLDRWCKDGGKGR